MIAKAEQQYNANNGDNRNELTLELHVAMTKARTGILYYFPKQFTQGLQYSHCNNTMTQMSKQIKSIESATSSGVKLISAVQSNSIYGCIT